MSKTAIIYARVSTSRQADDGLPVDGQIEQGYKRADNLGADVLEVFRDDGISGRTAQRPGFQAALDYCERFDIDYFVVWSSSRFARNHIDAGLYKLQLEKLGTRVMYVSQDMGESEDTWMMEAFTAIIDESYSRQISKDTRRSLIKNAAAGYFNGGRPPFGFKSVPDGKRRRLAPVEEEALTVRMIFRWYLNGDGYKDIASRLNHMGNTRRGLAWTKNAVGLVLDNPAVIGETRYRDKSGEIRVPSHAAIVEKEIFMAAIEVREGREPRKAGGAGRSMAVFTGMLKCECGESMTTEHARGRSGVYSYYNCHAAQKKGTCGHRRVRVDRFDPWMTSIILDRILSEEEIRGIMDDTYKLHGEWTTSRAGRMAALQKEKATIEAKQARLYDLLESGGGEINLGDISPRLRENKARLQAINDEILGIESVPVPTVEIEASDIDRIRSIFRGIVEDRENPKAARHLFGGLIDKIVLGATHLKVMYHPDRLVNREANFAVHSGEVRWLPKRDTLRTVEAVHFLPSEFVRKPKKAA